MRNVAQELEMLVAYTAWLRDQWRGHFDGEGEALLQTPSGSNGDGRFVTVGAVVRHIFGAEARYVDRIRRREARDVGSVSSESATELFDLAETARADLRALLREWPAEAWDDDAVYPIGAFEFEGTPRKMVAHVLIHEIRHWAQLGTTLRLAGHAPPLHDLLVSPVLGGEFRRRREPPE